MVCLAALAIGNGCGEKPVATVPPSPSAPAQPIAPAPAPEKKSIKVIPAKPKADAPPTTANNARPGTPQLEAPKRTPGRQTQGTLADLVEAGKPQGPKNEFGDILTPLPQHDEAKLAAAGIRKLASKHLILFTDLMVAPETEELPAVFDAAIPQWSAYFGIDPKRTAEWKLVGYLIGDKARFQGAGLMPDDLPPFLNGYQRGSEFWMYERPSGYMHRYLLVHEGTHGFMYQFLGGAGPPWYTEGTAELFGTHDWKEGKLQTRVMPASKEASPYWGRIKLIREDYTADRGLHLVEVMKIDQHAFLKNEPYAWSWAACYFLDQHPKTQGPFRALKSRAADRTTDFSRSLYDSIKADWPAIQEDWQVFIAHLDYGYDFSQALIIRKPSEALPSVGATVKIPASAFWQSSGYRLEAGRKYRVTAKGRYEIANDPQPWPCEPGGVTLRYYRGQPLGKLLGAITDSDPVPTVSPLVHPLPIGLAMDVTPTASGALYFGVNEFPADLADNRGELEIRIEPAP